MSKEEFKIKPFRKKGGSRKKPLGKRIIDELYSRIFMIAPTSSGKTTVLGRMLNEIVDERVTVLFFVGTFYHDEIYHHHIVNLLKKKKVNYEVFTSIQEDGVNLLEQFIKTIESPTEEEVEGEKNPEENRSRQRMDSACTDMRRSCPERMLGMRSAKNETKLEFNGINTVLFNINPTHVRTCALREGSRSEEEKLESKPPHALACAKRKRRKKKYKTEAPKYLIIIDDLPKEDLRSNAVFNLLKQARHHQSKIIISSQHFLDLAANAFNQLSHCYLYGGITPHYLKMMLTSRVTLPINNDEFIKLYNDITKENYKFMNINLKKMTYRINFGRKKYNLNNNK